MANRKGRTPRIAIGIRPETKDLLERLAAVMDSSVSKVAGGIIDDAYPQLLSLVEAMEKAKADPATSATTMHLALIQAQRYALEAQADFLENRHKPKP